MTSYKNLPVIARDGLPGSHKALANGQLYINTLDGSVYQAREVGDSWTWEEFKGSGGSSGPSTPPIIFSSVYHDAIPASEAKNGYFYYFLGTSELFICRVLGGGTVEWRLVRETPEDPS